MNEVLGVQDHKSSAVIQSQANQRVLGLTVDRIAPLPGLHRDIKGTAPARREGVGVGDRLQLSKTRLLDRDDTIGHSLGHVDSDRILHRPVRFFDGRSGGADRVDGQSDVSLVVRLRNGK